MNEERALAAQVERNTSSGDTRHLPLEGMALVGSEAALGQMALLMKGMADTIRSMSDRITTMEKELRQMTPITGSQAEAISKAIRDRAQELAEHASLTTQKEAVRDIGNLIRKDLRLASGIRSVKELPRVEYLVALERIGYWDDYKQMKALRGKYSK